MADTNGQLTMGNTKTVIEKIDHLHPQTTAFFNLFPQPDGSISSTTIFAQKFQELWDMNCKDLPWSLLGFSATLPKFSDESAEKGGNDYTCRLRVHFESKTSDIKIDKYIDDLPYPNNTGEFVINGNRYFIPMFLRNKKLRKRMESKRTYYKELKEIKNNANLNEDDAETLKAALLENRKKSKEDSSKDLHDRST